jgi:hypothetical protein
MIDSFFVRESTGMSFIKKEVVLGRHGRVGFVDDTTGFNEVIKLSVGAMELLKYLVFHEFSSTDFAFRNLR